MRIDAFTRLVLAVIAVALTFIALRPLVTPTPSYAARPVEYKIVKLGMNFPHPKSEAELNELGKEGWDISTTVGVVMVMKR